MSALAWLAILAIALGVAVVSAVFRRRPGRPQPPRRSDHFRVRLAALDSRAFEALVVEAFRLQGYHVVTTTAVGGGRWLMRRDRETCLVDCKHWRDAKVGGQAIVALQRSMQSAGAASGFALTCGRFSREAAAQASDGTVRLIEGPALEGLLAKAEKR